MAAASCQVITATGDYNGSVVKDFFASTRLEYVGRDYQVVAIMGPQSSGKSTLLNNVFGTSFVEMNAMVGRQQTTKGIWLALSPKVNSPSTLVLDLEGNDGRERGEDDTSFERQTALFALAVADVVLINMWAKDIGRETGAGKPLLKTIFQVNLKLFTPAVSKRKTVLLFVFRDRTKTPLEKLVEVWEADLSRMWEGITKPEQYMDLPFTDFFEVKYAALANFEEREEDFKAEAVMLRRRFTHDEGEDTLVRLSDDKIPGNAVVLHMETAWDVIKSNKDLNLPAHRVMVANIRCEEIVQDQLSQLQRDQAYESLRTRSRDGLVPDFGIVFGNLLSSCLTGYDEEARYFDATVSSSKRESLTEQLQELGTPLWKQQTRHLQEAALQSFARQLAQETAAEGSPGFAKAAARSKACAVEFWDKQVRSVVPTALTWDVQGARAAVDRALDDAIASSTQAHVKYVLEHSQSLMGNALTSPTVVLLDAPTDDLWIRLQKLYERAAGQAYERVVESVSGYDVPEAQLLQLQKQLQDAAQHKLEGHMREAANTALSRLRDRFSEAFSKDDNGMPRSWGPRANVPQTAKSARGAAAHLLAQLAVIRRPDQQYDVVDDVIAIMTEAGHASTSASNTDVDALSLSDWPGIPQPLVLLSPPTCRSVWRQFVSDSNLQVQQAAATQEANRAASNKAPPLWALLAIVLLGWNEFVALLYNPLWLFLVGLIAFFGRTVYQELDVETELQRGLLPGLIALSAKFVPTVKKVAKNTVGSAKKFVESHAEGDVLQQQQNGSMASHHTFNDVGASSSIELTSAAGLRSRPAVSAATATNGPMQ